MDRVGAHAGGREPTVELDGEEGVRGLRLPVGEPLLVGATIEMDVLEDDRREPVTARAERHDARRRRRPQRGREQPGQEEVSEMIGRELELPPLGRTGERAGHHTGVVDEHVQRGPAREILAREAADARR